LRVWARNVPRIRVFHCDDSPAFTRLVRLWLDDHEEFEHVGAAHTGPDALDAIPGAQPDVVLLDTMGSPGDQSLLSAIRDRCPATRVVVLSGYLSLVGEGELGDAADGYLAKGDDEAALVAMLRAVTAR
jgi:DNA-binding NarL/FixJ family response regulator